MEVLWGQVVPSWLSHPKLSLVINFFMIGKHQQAGCATGHQIDSLGSRNCWLKQEVADRTVVVLGHLFKTYNMLDCQEVSVSNAL